jgi:hypothetical protein
MEDVKMNIRFSILVWTSVYTEEILCKLVQSDGALFFIKILYFSEFVLIWCNYSKALGQKFVFIIAYF